MTDDGVKLRKYENILVISGMGVIAFGLWSVIKAVLYAIIEPVDLTRYFPPGSFGGLSAHPHLITWVFLSAVFVVLLIDLLMRVYVGRSAISVGKGKKEKKTVYIILAVFIALSLISSIAGNLMETEQSLVAAWRQAERDVAAENAAKDAAAGDAAKDAVAGDAAKDAAAENAAKDAAAWDAAKDTGGELRTEDDRRKSSDETPAAGRQQASGAFDAEKAVEEGLSGAKVSIFVDITALLALVELIIASIQVRRLRKKLSAGPIADAGREDSQRGDSGREDSEPVGPAASEWIGKMDLPEEAELGN